ncbi:protein IQ-DOMAIN 32-like [Chenopodium quinoa]|uniref:protein IQ-DOMAIN 32-like n=1 Tax=Chenopodium quinoa TaxID=63459 RepID=UPI000B7793E2|nr:protein IQ-DOMAIN 32-like [Chenopodium quinoa]
MGKSSSSSCLKIIVCGGDAAENDDVHSSSEAKTPNDKRGWSFRKRSGRHRVLGNNVNSETTTLPEKETPQAGSINFQAPVKPTSADEKPQLPRPVDEISKAVVASENDNELKTSLVVVTSENGSTREESKVIQDQDAFQSVSNKTSAEYKVPDADVVSEFDSKETSAESKMADAVVISEYDSKETSAESNMADAAVVSGYDSKETAAESKMADAAVVSEYDSKETSAESEMADAVVGSEHDNKETSAEYKVVEAVDVSENESNDTSDESSIASESSETKDSSIKSDEPKLSESEVTSETACNDSLIMDETVAIIIQTAVRGFLARRTFVQLKSAVKLQAVIHGHLVRRNAVETLHCIKAIVKVQSLVRARSSKSLGQKTKPNDAQFSIVKLLQNSFTRQLLESTSKPKSLNIRCDPMKPNSAWSWLERWMDVSTSEVAEKLEPSEEPDNLNEAQKSALQADDKSSPPVFCDSLDSSFSMRDREESVETEDIADDVTIGDTCSGCPLSTDFMIEQSHLQKQDTLYEDVASAEIESSALEITHTKEEPVLDDIPATLATEIQQPKLSMKRSATSELNDEGKKFVYGSRKSSNPAFIAAHSKFEELTSSGNSEKLNVLSDQDVESEPYVNLAPSLEGVKKRNKSSDVEASETLDPRIHVARSECGTELSISSTLDSPDRSDMENAEALPEVRFLEETSCLPGGEKQDDAMLSNCVTDVPSTLTEQGEFNESNGVFVDPVAVEASPQVDQILETKESDVQSDIAPVSSETKTDSSTVKQNHQENGCSVPIEHEPSTGRQTYKLSPEASPQSHKTISESQGTPSSQASVKGKRNKIERHGSNKKRNPPSAEKRSPLNTNVDSGARSSTENLPKDHKSAKRRNSFGSTKSDIADQESRDSSSRLPSYMQATESARAKASSSPRSSPDVHDKLDYSKKRHSLPATGRQGSPHINRSASESAKANGSHPSNERKWQR